MDARWTTCRVPVDRDGDAIFWQPADGSGSAERLTDPKAVLPNFSNRVSANGKVVYRDGRGDGDIWMFSLDGDRKPQAVIVGAGNQTLADMSPDGRWIVYVSQDAGRQGLYVEPVPPTGAKYQIATSNGSRPIWSRDGRQIFFVEQAGGPTGRLMSIEVRTDGGFAYANPTRIFEPMAFVGGWAYDVMPDGRFVVLVRPSDADLNPPSPEIRVTLNWFEELRQRVPRGR